MYRWLNKFHSNILINPFRSITTTTMAKSKFEYVRQFESETVCLPNCWMVIRIDGRNFSKFTDSHQFVKPNDARALELMNRAATTVMDEFREIVLAFGQSDEYSFIFKKDSQVFNRRAYKLVSNINSLFSTAYVFNWSEYFVNIPLQYPPAFDARVIMYPSDQNLRDYLSWRQADVHVNNLYNTCFWNLVQRKNLTTSQAEEQLRGTLAADKNELLFHDFGINYNNELPMFRKGTTLIRKMLPDENGKIRQTITPIFDDIIGEKFWKINPDIIGPKLSRTQEIKLNKINSLQNKNSEVNEIK